MVAGVRDLIDPARMLGPRHVSVSLCSCRIPSVVPYFLPLMG